MSRFKITVIENCQERQVIGKSWEKGADPVEGNPEKYGYTPEVESWVDIERKVYEQNVEFLELEVVIDAVNSPPLDAADKSILDEFRKKVIAEYITESQKKNRVTCDFVLLDNKQELHYTDDEGVDKVVIPVMEDGLLYLKYKDGT